MKKIIISLVMMFAAIGAFAQQTTVEGSQLFDNTTISVYGGGSAWFNPGVVNEDTFWQGVRPTTGISFGKWFTPVVGAELFYEGGINNFPFSSEADRWTFYDWANLGLNAQFNVNNMFGYKGYAQRVEVVPFAGIGWGHGFTDRPGSNLTSGAYNEGDHTSNFLTADAGARLDINMGKKRAWQINIRPSVTWLLAGEGLDVQFNKNHAYAAVQAGVTYRFGHKNSTGAKTHNFTSAYTVADYNALQNELALLQAKYDEKPKEVTVEKVTERIIEKQVPVEVIKRVNVFPMPHFLQGRAFIDATSLSNLDNMIEEINSNTDNYVITGYASEEGDKTFNENLSLQRAENVKKYLVKNGVDANRLETRGLGRTTFFGKNPADNRVVTIEKK